MFAKVLYDFVATDTRYYSCFGHNYKDSLYKLGYFYYKGLQFFFILIPLNCSLTSPRKKTKTMN